MKTIKLLILTIMLSLVYSCDRQREYAQHVKRFEAVLYNNKTYGTGFNLKVGEKVYVITNKHVCDVSDRIGHPGMAMVNGEPLKILKISDKHDLCALESTDKHGLDLAWEDVEPLDKITLIGHPRGLDMVIREGRIISEDIEVKIMGSEGVETHIADQISALAYGGNSGSPVINEYGRVVGVLFAGSAIYPNEPLVVPYEYLKEFVESL